MKKRRVVITIEANSNQPVTWLRKAMNVTLRGRCQTHLETVVVEQIDVNVIRAKPRDARKK